MAVAGDFGGPRGRAPGLLVSRGPASFSRRTTDPPMGGGSLRPLSVQPPTVMAAPIQHGPRREDEWAVDQARTWTSLTRVERLACHSSCHSTTAHPARQDRTLWTTHLTRPARTARASTRWMIRACLVTCCHARSALLRRGLLTAARPLPSGGCPPGRD